MQRCHIVVYQGPVNMVYFAVLLQEVFTFIACSKSIVVFRFILFSSDLIAGKYHGLPIVEMHAAMRNDFGDIIRIPGLLGRTDMLLTYKPCIFEKVFRTEGPFPERRGLETFIYYRKKVRPEIFGDTGGLLSEHGEKWLDVRSKVNPVMLQPRVVKMYVSKVDQIADEFLCKMRKMRDPLTLEMTNKFGHELNCWALETVGELALDERLGLLDDTQNHHGSTIINVSFSYLKID